MIVGVTRVELARVFVLDQRRPLDSKSGASTDSAILRLSSYGRCPPREGDRESPSHRPNPRARPSRRLADSRRLGHQVKAATSFRLLSGFQAGADKPRKPLGLNAFHAAACCVTSLVEYRPGSGRAIRCSSTKRTSVDLREFIRSAGRCSAAASSAAEKLRGRLSSKNPITRSVSDTSAVAVTVVATATAAGCSLGKSESISASIARSLPRVASISLASSMIRSRLLMMFIPSDLRDHE